MLHNKVFCNALVLYDRWNQELEQTNGAESRRTVRRWLVHITSSTTVFSRWMGGKNGFKVYSKPVMFWKQSEGFKGSFQTCRNVHYCQRSCSNLNHTGQTYCNCPFFFFFFFFFLVCTVSSDSEIAFGTFWLFPENYRFLYTSRGYCTPGPYFWRLFAFCQKIKQLWTK